MNKWKFSLQVLKVDGLPVPDSSLGFHEVVCKRPEGRKYTCHVCNGTGKVRGETCVRCAGTGFISGVPAFRLTVNGSVSKPLLKYMDQLYQWCETIGVDFEDIVSMNIPLYEAGGYSKQTGSGVATIVSGLRGEKLRCFHTDNRPLGHHAFFWVEIALLVQVRHGKVSDGKYQGRVILVSDDDEKDYSFGVKRKKLYHFSFKKNGEIKDLRRLCNTKVDFPEEAAKAAILKSFDPNCTKVYWAILPSGY